MNMLSLAFIILGLSLVYQNSFGSSMAANEEKIWMIGCDGKVYERSNDSEFKNMTTKFLVVS